MTTTSTDNATASAVPAAGPPEPGVLQVWSDLLCPFAHVALHGLARAQAALDLDDPAARVQLEHRIFPLELFNGPHPRRGTDTEAVGLGQIAPDAGFRVWTAPDELYPHTVLLAAEAVLAASAQSLTAGRALDQALRVAFWTQSRSIAHRKVILEVATETAAARPDAGLDLIALAQALDTGRHRADLMADFALASTDAIPTSPSFITSDGHTSANPSLQVHWEGPWAEGFPVVDHHDAGVYAELLRRAAG